jgi:hypothetical protein
MSNTPSTNNNGTANVYRVAHWGGAVYRVERQHRGRDGRTLSIGDYSAGAEHYGREELTYSEAVGLVDALNAAAAAVDGVALELATALEVATLAIRARSLGYETVADALSALEDHEEGSI